MLERYRPILRYDSREEYFAQPVSLPPETAEVRGGDRVYGHVAVERGETWLQYWLFYAYNSQDRSPLRIGRHEGDWELVQYRLDARGQPTLVTLGQHSWAEGCSWAAFEQGSTGAPILYVANGSHASYSRAGSYDRPFPDPNDEADGQGREVRPAVTEITDARPAWVRYSGHWGTTEAGFIPGEMSSPVGPRFQASGAWSRPSSYFEDLARPCGSGAPGRPWQTAVEVGAVALLAVAGLSLMRRRRARRRA
jgi:Vacuolar protein sorting-associated protein 62